MVLIFFERMLPSTTDVIRVLCLKYDRLNISCIFCNKSLKDFVEHQMSKEKFTPLLVMNMWNFKPF